MEIDLSNASPEELLKAYEAAESGAELAAASATDAAATEVKPDEAAKAAQEAADAAAAKAAEEAAEAAKKVAAGEAAKVETTQENEGNVEGVLARDGKNVIPFSVLKSERDRAARAEQLAKEASDKIAALEAQLAAGNQGAKSGEGARTTEAAPEADAMTPEELEAFKEDFPIQYKAYMAQQATIKALRAQHQQVEQDRQQQQVERQRTQAEQVRDAIDATPKLAHIQATDPDRFATAQRFDAVLREDPKWADKPLAERFAEVVKLVETTHGAIEIPGAKTNPPQKSPEELRKEAEAVAAASAKKTVPTSMSDFPAGAAPANSEKEALETMTHAQLADKFAKMTPDQLDAYFNSI